MGTVEEEADECMLWLELLRESRFVTDEVMQPLHQEANEIVATTIASIKTTKRNQTAATQNPFAIRNPNSTIK